MDDFLKVFLKLKLLNQDCPDVHTFDALAAYWDRRFLVPVLVPRIFKIDDAWRAVLKYQSNMTGITLVKVISAEREICERRDKTRARPRLTANNTQWLQIRDTLPRGTQVRKYLRLSYISMETIK